MRPQGFADAPKALWADVVATELQGRHALGLRCLSVRCMRVICLYNNNNNNNNNTNNNKNNNTYIYIYIMGLYEYACVFIAYIHTYT